MTARIPLPELIGRGDETAGPWQIHSCAALRGEPRTAVAERIMVVPIDDSERSRVIRAHELMHARVSPGSDWPSWVARGAASEVALRAAEEFRVNWLTGRAGFPVQEHLRDGTEEHVGCRLAEEGDWSRAVYFAAACGGTAAMAPFLAGIGIHRPGWVAPLRAVENWLAGQASGARRRRLSAVRTDTSTGLAPAGFLPVEAWAVVLDGLAERDVNSDGDDTLDATVAHLVSEVEAEIACGQWPEVRVGRLPLVLPAPGGLGRKRRAADRGRAPRRIHRLLTDPQRRVFDQHKRGNGGVVLIDGSGSMRLSEQDVRDILTAAPGATVAIYACTTGDEPENLWVLADRGRMAERIPDRTHGNGVDLPALGWAAGQRQHSRVPLVWITDGLVHQPHLGSSNRVALECIQATLEHDALVRPNVESAIAALRELASGREPGRWWPQRWREAWSTLRFTPLESIEIEEAATAPPRRRYGPSDRVHGAGTSGRGGVR